NSSDSINMCLLSKWRSALAAWVPGAGASGTPPLRRAVLVWLHPATTACGVRAMNHRHLGQSGLLVSEISYGNWITHGSQVEKDAAIACVRTALEEGITTFDTADVYAATR